MKTQIFKDYQEFAARPDKRVNGVDPYHVTRYPNYEADNETNEGCWCCVNCTGCVTCGRCQSCVLCTRCVCCVECGSCTRSRNCRRCAYVTDEAFLDDEILAETAHD